MGFDSNFENGLPLKQTPPSIIPNPLPVQEGVVLDREEIPALIYPAYTGAAPHVVSPDFSTQTRMMTWNAKGIWGLGALSGIFISLLFVTGFAILAATVTGLTVIWLIRQAARSIFRVMSGRTLSH